MSLDLYSAYVIACLVIVLLPGPTITLIIATSIRHGTRAGLANVAGTQVGLAVMIAVVGIGLDLADRRHGPLVRMAAPHRRGLPHLDGHPDVPLERHARRRPARRATPRGGFFLQGVLVAASNPKTLIFFGAFFPQFIDPAGNYTLQIVVMGVTAMVIAAISDGSYALLGGRAGRFLSTRRVEADLAHQRQLPGRRRPVAGVFPGEVAARLPP